MVNAEIPHELCTLVYPSLDDAVRLCIQSGVSCKMGKSDMSMAFRHVPMSKVDWPLLLMKATNPDDGQTYYFVDKCMPFGSSISCSIFQRFSNAVAHIVKCKTKRGAVNYLDDFFFAALLKLVCDGQLETFLQVCKQINFPAALEKTHWGSTLMTFLGLLLDSENQRICIPKEKLDRAIEMISKLLLRRSKKAKVLEFQKLCGYLNFLCRAIVPGRVFLRRLYSVTANSQLKPHHHVKISAECRLDLALWLTFLNQPAVFSRPFLDLTEITSEEVDIYSDASGNFSLGFGAYCGTKWTFGQWNHAFMKKCTPSIEFLELFAVAVAMLN